MPSEELKNRLIELYGDRSKHSQYQNVPEFVRDSIGYAEKIDEEWRGDTARYNYIVEEIKNQKPASICDIGANTGFFSLSLAHKFPGIKVTAFEGNEKHVEFMRLIQGAFALDNLTIIEKYIDKNGIEYLGHYDMLLHLNVLHHAGVDFDKDKTNRVSLDDYLIAYFKDLIAKTNTMIFQMGYNWGGDKSQPIVELHNDFGKIDYSLGVFEKSGWKASKIAHIEKEKSLVYKNYSSSFVDALYQDRHNSSLRDIVHALGLHTYSEFYRRPIFILQYCNV
jgi:hypothetical protein